MFSIIDEAVENQEKKWTEICSKPVWKIHSK